MQQPMVLVVEDESSFVEALTVGLGREGFRVSVAVDGVEALGALRHRQPDVVLLDVMLPKISGIDVCRELRKRSQVPIIMVTAKSAEIDTVVGLEVGADDYVTKPYRIRELVARMRAVMRRTSAEGGAGSELSAGSITGRRCRARPRRASGDDRRRRGVAPLEGVRTAAPAPRQRRSGAAAGDLDRPGLGERLRSATRRPSTCTSSGCAPRSSRTRPCRSGSSRSAGSATSTSARADDRRVSRPGERTSSSAVPRFPTMRA